MIHLDTHVVVWLYAGEIDRLSDRARELIETHSPAICPMVALELQYLAEIGRVAEGPEVVVPYLRDRIDLTYAPTHWHDAVRRAFAASWTRDPFDRLIVACAEVEEAQLLTRDEEIHRHSPAAVWDVSSRGS